MTTIGASYKMESAESSALKSINVDSYDYRDQAKLLTKVTSDISYMAQYMRTMQKGIDSANENVIQQIGDFINEIGVLLGGGGDTGFDFGDLKYIFQAIGALFGFDQQSGIASIFPINLFSAAWHFFSTYIIPIDNFGDFINWIIDQFIASMLDLFGEIPIVGNALQQLAMWITDIRDVVNGLGDLFAAWTAPFVEWLTSTVTWLYETFLEWTEPIATWVYDSLSWLIGLFGGWTSEIVTQVINTINWVINLFGTWTAPLVTWITNSLSGLMAIFGDWSVSIGNWVRSSLTWLNSIFTAWTEPFTTWLSNTVTFLSNMFGDWSSSVATWIHDSVTWLTGLFGTWTAPFVSLIKNVVDAVQDIVDWITGGIGAAIHNLFPWAQTLPQMQVVNGTNKIKTANVPKLDASTIDSGTLSDTVIPVLSSSKISAGAITSDKIADAAVNTAKLSDLAVSGSKIANSAVDNLKIADSAISTIKIADSAVTGSKTSSLDATKVTTGSFSVAQIPSLDTSKITTGNFSQSMINNLTSDLGAKLPTTTFQTNIQDGSNLAIDSSYEIGLYDLSWGGTTTRSSDVARTGSYSMKMTAPGGGGVGRAYATSTVGAQFNNCAGGDTYYIECYFYGKTTNTQTGNNAAVSLYFGTYDVAYNFINWYQASWTYVNTSNNGVWTKISGYATFPSNAKKYQAFLQLESGAAAGEVYYVDDFTLRDVSHSVAVNKSLYGGLSYVPASSILGTVIPGLDAAKITTGTFAQSMVSNLSTDLGNKLASTLFDSKIMSGTNLAPDIENSDVPLTVYGTAARSTAVKRSGSNSVKVTGAWAGVAIASRLTADTIKCNPGDVFYVEGWGYGATTNTQANGVADSALSIFAMFWDGAGNFLSYFDMYSTAYAAAGIGLNGVWSKLYGYITAPANAVKMGVRITTRGGVLSTDSYYFDDLILREITDSNAINKKLYNADVPVTNILSSALPVAIDASKLTTGYLPTSAIADAQLTQAKVSGLPTDLSNAKTRLSTVLSAGSNLAPDPSFENSTTFIGDAARNTNATYVRSGTTSLKLVGTGVNYPAIPLTGNGIDGWTVGDRCRCNPNDIFYSEIWVKGATTNVQVASANWDQSTIMIFFWYDSSGNYINLSFPSSPAKGDSYWLNTSTALNGVWSKLYGYVQAPSNAAYMTVKVRLGASTAANETYYFDDAVIREVSGAANINSTLFNKYETGTSLLTSRIPQLDGSIISSGNVSRAYISELRTAVDHIYNGLAGDGNGSNIDPANLAAPIKSLQNVTQTPNLCISPSFEDSTIVRTIDCQAGDYSTTQKYIGTQSYRLTTSATGYRGLWLMPSTKTINTADRKTAIPCNVGDVFYVEVWAYVPTATSLTGVYTLAFTDNGAGSISAFTITDGTPSMVKDTWMKISGTFTVPAGQTHVWFKLNYTNNPTAGQYVYIDNVIVREITQLASTNTSLFNSKTSATQIIGNALPTAIDASKLTTGLLPTSAIANNQLTQEKVVGLPTLNAAATGSFQSGSNLTPDPSFENDSMWAGVFGTPDSTIKRSGTKSRKLTSAGGYNAVYLIGNALSGNWIKCSPKDVFYIELWVYPASTNASATTTFAMQSTCWDSTNAANVNYSGYSSGTLTKGQWNKVSGYITIPDPPLGATYTYDNWSPYVWLTPTANPSGEIYYIDDVIVREVNESTTIKQALYNSQNTSSTILTSVIPNGVDATKLSGTIDVARLPSSVTTLGSGAMVKRTSTSVSTVYSGRHLVETQFFDTVDPSNADIRVVRNADATGFNAFQTRSAGWFLAELCYHILPHSNNLEFVKIAPVIYTGEWSTGMTAQKVGTDIVYNNNNATSQAPRYCQASFIIYLPLGWYVGAGYDVSFPVGKFYSNILKADGTGLDSYFSLSLLNRSLV